MPIIKSAKKAARQAEKRTAHNEKIKKDIKVALKAFKSNPTQESFSKAQSEYDKAVKKDLLKKNTASRRKAKLAELAKKAGLKLQQVKKAASTKPAAKATAKPAAKKTAAKPAAKAATAKTAKTTTKKAAAKTTQSKAKAAKK